VIQGSDAVIFYRIYHQLPLHHQKATDQVHVKQTHGFNQSKQAAKFYNYNDDSYDDNY